MGPRHPSPAQPAPLLSFLSPCGRRQQTGACSFSADGDEDDEEDEAVEDDDGDESKEDEPSPFDFPQDDLPDVNNHFSDRKLSMLYSAVSNEKLELKGPPMIQTMYQIIDGMASFHSLFSSECSYDCRNAASYWWRCKRALREFNATAYTSKTPHEKNHVNEYINQRDDD
ncbi:hypothetical protein MUK42_13042 [Musa troglodytarum]|uniref:Uncharacterized protein n=1 Tax=Musa troglodytarum TaxID=320322 RepID=A0A9E7KWK4_9LILI|nr:hypothetical protein MUK42_13042 [Musa troglodytarum]